MVVRGPDSDEEDHSLDSLNKLIPWCHALAPMNRHCVQSVRKWSSKELTFGGLTEVPKYSIHLAEMSEIRAWLEDPTPQINNMDRGE
jgi:hypothetical protein